MQFKITVITGIFCLLMSSLSIANPISRNEIPPKKTEQTHNKKLTFIQKIILKKIQKKIERSKERASSSAKISFWLGILSIPLLFAYLIGIPVAIAAIVLGRITIRREKNNKKSRTLAKIGIAFGVILITYVVFALGAIYLIENFPLGE